MAHLDPRLLSIDAAAAAAALVTTLGESVVWRKPGCRVGSQTEEVCGGLEFYWILLWLSFLILKCEEQQATYCWGL